MVKRSKRLEKGIESIKKEIEEHFIKLEKDIKEDNIEMGRYHAKEIVQSLIGALEHKIKLLKIKDDSAEEYRKRLDRLKKEIE